MKKYPLAGTTPSGNVTKNGPGTARLNRAPRCSGNAPLVTDVRCTGTHLQGAVCGLLVRKKVMVNSRTLSHMYERNPHGSNFGFALKRNWSVLKVEKYFPGDAELRSNLVDIPKLTTAPQRPLQ